MLNTYFKNKNMCAFWNKLKSNNYSKTNSKLTPKDLANHYNSTMTDSNHLAPEQEEISQTVREKAATLSCICTNKEFTHYTNDCTGCGYTGKEIDLSNHSMVPTERRIIDAINSLKKSPSSGYDGITVSHLFHAISDLLIKVLYELYSAIITTSTVPDTFAVGIIVPILKKATLCSNDPNNY